MFTSSKFVSTKENELKKSNDYVVKINGKNIDVYTCRISKYPLNTVWPGHQRDISQSEEVSFINIVSDEILHFEITANKSFEKIYLKPYSKKISVESKDKKIFFDIKENGFYVLELDDYHGLLYIFNQNYIPCKNKENVTYYFDKGVYNVGTLELKSNESVYVDKDAYVFGSIYAENAVNIKIYGNGIFDQSKQERTTDTCLINGNIKFVKCCNVKVKGVGFTNSCSWCVSIFNCFDVMLDGIKVFGQWKYNTDGIDIVNSQDVTVCNSFIHSFDDTITIKAYDESLWVDGIGDCNTDCKNILIEGCTLICDWGRCLELGYETACKEYTNIIWRDIDILHVSGTAISVHNGDYAEIHNILYKNIRIELNAFDTPEQYQQNDEMQYEYQNRVAEPAIFGVGNPRFRNNYGVNTVYPDFVKEFSHFASCHDIKAIDVFVYYDKNLPKKDGKYNAWLYIEHIVEGSVFENITMENLIVNNEKITEDNAVVYFPEDCKIEIK